MARPKVPIPLLVGFILLVATSSVFAQQDTDYKTDGDFPVPTNVQKVTWSGPLTPVFQNASSKYNVPLPLLLTLAYFGSHFENRGDAPTIEGGYGVMALRQNDNGGTSLADAGTLTSATESDLKLKADANIMGGAAVLDSYAKMMQIDRSGGLDAWLDVVIKYAALDPTYSRMFAMEIYQKLKSGMDAVNSEGERFSFDPQDIGSVNIASLEPAGIRANVTGYSGATWYPAGDCNYTASYCSKTTLIIHAIEGSASGCLSWFRNCNAEVSAHYVVSETGQVWQCVDEDYKAWHVGCANSYCIGIEHEGHTADASHPIALYNASAKLAKDICDRWGIPKQHNTCPPGILGHLDINNCVCHGDHTDPGPGWNWDYYIGAINGTNYINPPYLFGDGIEGWSSGNSVTDVTWTGADSWNGSIYFDQNGNDAWIYSPPTNITGSSSPQIVSVNLYPQSGSTDAHDMQMFWKTNADNAFTADKSTPVVQYSAQNAWRTVNLRVDNSKWSGQTVNQLRLDLDSINHGTRFIINQVVLQNALRWPFDTAGDVMGWTVGNALSTPWQTTSDSWPGCLVTDQTGNDGYLLSSSISGDGYPYNFIGAVNDRIHVRVYPQNGDSAAHDMAVYWVTDTDGTWNEDKSCHVTFGAQNAWADVYLPVGANSNWETQHITQIRLDFDQTNHNTRWIIDQISCEQPDSDTTPPSVPSGLTATAASDKIVNLSWTQSTDNMCVSGYKIYRNGTQIGTSAAPSYSDNSCSSQTTYSYTVSSYDAAGNNSAQSSPVSVTSLGLDNQAPTAPQNVRRTSAAKTSIALAWDASTDNYGVSGYRIFRNGTQVGSSATTTYTDSGLTAGTGYTYQIDAYDSVPNYSAKSAALTTGTANTWSRSNAQYDCYVRSGSPDVCGSGGIAVGYSSTSNLLIRRGLVQWDMTGAPTQDEILDNVHSVRIKLYQYTQTTASTAANISLYQVNDDWDESNGTWNNVGIGSIYTGATVSCAGTADRIWYYNGHVLGAPPANRGVYIKNDSSESSADYAKIFDDRANSGGSNLPPRLEIDYVDLTAPSDCSIRINGGAALTSHADVALALSATDTLTGVSQMQFSSDGVTYSAPEPYATTKSYTLPTGDGPKTVYAKFGDSVGNWSAPVSAAITLDSSAPTISSVTVSPAMAPGGYPVSVTAAVSDNTGISGVVAAGVALAQSGSLWIGIMPTDTGIGAHAFTVTATDTAGNRTDFASSYTIARVFGLNNSALGSTGPTQIGASTYLYKVWGTVKPVDADNFYISDGSTKPILVHCPSHGLTSGKLVSVVGIWNYSTNPPRIESTLNQIQAYN